MMIGLIRSLVLYFLVVFLYRLMGKRQIGEMQPGELVLAIMISDIASVPMQAMEVPLLSGVVPILALMCMEVFLSFAAQKSEKIRKIISGEPSLVILNGKIMVKEMKRLRFNLDDLFEQLRNQGYFDIGDVAVAILETNGVLSVLAKADKQTVTCKDMHIEASDEGYSNPVIKDGVVDFEALFRIGRNEKWLKAKLRERDIRTPQDVFLFCADRQKVTFVQLKKEKL